MRGTHLQGASNQRPAWTRRRWGGLTAFLLALCTACMSYQRRPVPQAPAPMQMLRGAMRVTLDDGTNYELRNVIVATDSLFGRTNDAVGIRVAVPLRRVTVLEERRRDLLLTAGMVLGIGVMVAVPRMIK